MIIMKMYFVALFSLEFDVPRDSREIEGKEYSSQQLVLNKDSSIRLFDLLRHFLQIL